MPQGLLTDGTQLPRAQAAAGAPSDRPWGQEPGLGQERWESSGGQACWELSAPAEGSGAVGLELQVCVCVYTCAHTHVF